MGNEVVTPNVWGGNEWGICTFFESWDGKTMPLLSTIKSKQHVFFQNPWQKSTATILAAVVTAPSSSLVSKIKRDWRSPSWKRGNLTWGWGRSGTSQSTSAAPASRQNSDYSNTSPLALRNEDWSDISGFRFPWHNFSKAQTSIFIMITFTF